MRNSTILFWLAFYLFIIAIILYNKGFKDIYMFFSGISSGCIIGNLLINFRKNLLEKSVKNKSAQLGLGEN